MCLVHNSKADPTNTAGPRQRVMRWMNKRKEGALREVKAYADGVPRNAITVNRTVYQYELTNRDPYLEINEIINRWFGTDGKRPPPRWFFELELENVTRQTTVTSAERINDLAEMAGEVTPYNVQSILTSQPYFERIRRVSQRAFENMKGFSGDTANDLARTLANEMAAGRGINEVKRKLAERFDVKMSRAETIARTELGKAHRDTRRDQSKDARDRLGLDVQEQWISALAPTSRRTHVARHLKIYTPEENEQFYLSPESQGGYINCLCSQQTVIRTKTGKWLGRRAR